MAKVYTTQHFKCGQCLLCAMLQSARMQNILPVPAPGLGLPAHRWPELAHDQRGPQLAVVEHNADARVRSHDIPAPLPSCGCMRKPLGGQAYCCHLPFGNVPRACASHCLLRVLPAH